MTNKYILDKNEISELEAIVSTLRAFKENELWDIQRDQIREKLQKVIDALLEIVGEHSPCDHNMVLDPQEGKLICDKCYATLSFEHEVMESLDKDGNLPETIRWDVE